MPQRFGLYEDLTVAENIDLYADLHGVTPEARAERYPRLMEMTNLGSFQGPIGRQALRWHEAEARTRLQHWCARRSCCSWMSQQWESTLCRGGSCGKLSVISSIHRGWTVLLSTAYLTRPSVVATSIVLHQGKVLAQGQPGDITDIARGRVFVAELAAGQSARGVQSRLLDEPGLSMRCRMGGGCGSCAVAPPVLLSLMPRARPPRGRGVAGLAAAAIPDATVPAVAVLDGARISAVPPRFEDGFMSLLRRVADQNMLLQYHSIGPLHASEAEVAVHVHNLARKFGTFTAVDHISFDVHRGAIFGLLGPNGAGKTTTFRMLCGLLPATDGELRVAGADVPYRTCLCTRAPGLRCSKILPLRHTHSRRETWISSQVPTACGGREKAPASPGRSSNSSWVRMPRIPAPSSPVVSNSASQWQLRCSMSRRSCFSMSPPVAQIRWRGARSGVVSPRLRSRASRSL